MEAKLKLLPSKAPPRTPRVSHAAEILKLREANTKLRDDNAELQDEIEELKAMVELLRAQVSGHSGLLGDPTRSPMRSPMMGSAVLRP